MSESSIDPILGRVPSGIFILTATHGDQSTGMLASWVMQAGFEPPMLTVAVKQGRYVNDWLTAGQPFVLNVVSHEDKTLLKHFGKGFEASAPAFEGLELRTSGLGVPILAGSLGFLECQAKSHLDSGDHRIFLAEVLSGELHQEDKPMVHVRKSGRNY